MYWVAHMLESKSKYNKTLPYTYEARVRVLEWDDAYNSYYSDTICGLIDFLREKNICPDQVSLYQIYQDHESTVETKLCIDGHDLWLARPKLCHSLHDHYKWDVNDVLCSFKNRKRVAFNP